MDQDPSWTLEFAVIPGSAAQAGSSRSQQGLILPFPAEKERPAFPADVVRKYLNKMVIVYGVVNIEGKLEQVSIKESPDALLNEPVLQILEQMDFSTGTTQRRTRRNKTADGHSSMAAAIVPNSWVGASAPTLC